MESICYIAVEDANICNVLQRSRVSNGSIVIQLIRDLNYRGYTYSKPFFSHIMYQTLTYLKSHNKLYDDISITKGLLSKSMFRFSDIVETQMQIGCVFKQLFPMNNKLLKIFSETDSAWAEDPLNIYTEVQPQSQFLSLRFQI